MTRASVGYLVGVALFVVGIVLVVLAALNAAPDVVGGAGVGLAFGSISTLVVPRLMQNKS